MIVSTMDDMVVHIPRKVIPVAMLASPLLFEEALAQVDTNRELRVTRTVDLKRVIGLTDCVPVGPEDTIEYVRLNGMFGRVPVVRTRKREPSQLITFTLYMRHGTFYELVEAYVGEKRPPYPWDPTLTTAEADAESIKFWSEHALVFYGQIYRAGSLTTVRPW